MKENGAKLRRNSRKDRLSLIVISHSLRFLDLLIICM
jgi:hypothetical protein